MSCALSLEKFTIIIDILSMLVPCQTYNSEMPLKAGMVAQSVMSATDMLGKRDVRSLSVTDPRPQITIITMPKDLGMQS